MIKNRKKINKIDKKLIKLLEQRLDIVEEIKIYKKENNIKIYDSEREKIIFQKYNDLSSDKHKKDIKRIMKSIIKISRNKQR